MEETELQRSLMAILFAAGEPVGAERLAFALGVTVSQVTREAKILMDRLNFHRSGIRIAMLDGAFQMCSDGAQLEVVTKALETRKPPKLSQSQLETLTIIAYYQPTTKVYVEQIRGVDSGYSISALLHKKLIAEQGRLNVPGRPILYGTTPNFLRTFAMESLDELPEIEKITFGIPEGQQLELPLEGEPS